MKLCFPHAPGSGGPGSFQIRFEKALQNKGWKINFAGQGGRPDVIMVVGGTKRWLWLWQMKKRGIPIIYRLDGLVWLHKKKQSKWKNYMLSQFRNMSSKILHAYLSDHIIYQSKFVKDWWERVGWKKKENYSIIYNGVKPPNSDQLSKEITDQNRLVVLEGTVDYSPYAVDLLNRLAESLPETIGIEVYGRFENPHNGDRLHERIEYFGLLPREEVFDVLQGSVYLSLDVNPACPNTVIEAMAVRSPVVAFDTGAIPELIDEDSGVIVPFGGDPWKMDKVNFQGIIEGVLKAFQMQGQTRGLRNEFTLDAMVQNYMEVIESTVRNNQ